MRLSAKLILIGLGALALRLFALQFVQHPGVGDPNHYYNLALRLLDGHGFTIDYIWQYYNPPAGLAHPEDFWMPLTAALAAGSMKVFGISITAALLPFVVLGSLLPLVGYAAARQMGCAEDTSLFAAASAGVLPELLLNSVRTDTTIPNTLFLGCTILALTWGLRSGRLGAFVISGVSMGLAYLTRGDNLLLLPMFAVTVILYALLCRPLPRIRWIYALSVPLVALLVASPWLIRNLQLTGSALTPNLSRLFFLTDFREHYAYGQDFNWQTLFASQTPMQLIGKRLFEMAASIKTMYVTLDVFLPVAVAAGGLLLIARRDKTRGLALAPALVLLAGTYVFYTLLAPIANQGGSFKKAYLSLIPLLLPLAAYALEQVVTDRRLRALVMALAVGFTALNAVELVRSDARTLSAYSGYIQTVVDAARELPDTNGDGEIVLMAQDPFMLRYLGVRSVMIPMSDRETVLAVARRYGVDYLMMPPARPALDPIYEGKEVDSRFVEARDLWQIQVKLYRLEVE